MRTHPGKGSYMFFVEHILNPPNEVSLFEESTPGDDEGSIEALGLLFELAQAAGAEVDACSREEGACAGVHSPDSTPASGQRFGPRATLHRGRGRACGAAQGVGFAPPSGGRRAVRRSKLRGPGRPRRTSTVPRPLRRDGWSGLQGDV